MIIPGFSKLKSVAMIGRLEGILTRFDVPLEIYTDSGTQLVGI